MFPEVGKQGNIGGKHNVSAAMFSSVPRALVRENIADPFHNVVFIQ